MSFLRNSLARRIVALMILASATLSVLAAAVQLYFSYRGDVARVMSEIEIVETSFLSGLENALWEFNFPQAEVLIDGIFAQNDIVAVELTATTGQEITRGEDTDTNTRDRVFDLVYAHPDGREEPVGRLSVSLSLEAVNQRLRSQFLTLVASNFLKTLAASVVMLLIFERMVSRHLRQITGYVRDLDWDTQDQALALDLGADDQADDLQNIVAALNDSRVRLQSSNAFASSVSARMQAVLNAATSGIIAFDDNHQMTMINPQAQHMLGLSKIELPLAWPEEIAFLDHENMAVLEASANPIERVLAGQVLINEISIMSRKDQGRDPRYVRISSAPLDPETSAGVRVVVVIDDVSEQEKNRQQVERVGRLDALGQLTGGVAHDFNNLLATISYSMELALQTDAADKRARYLKTAIASVERGASLTRRLLAFAKRQPGIAVSRPVSDILSEFDTLARPTIEEMIDLQITDDTDDLHVFCDVAQLENALLNLVINSRDAILRSGTGSKIMVRVRGVAEIDRDATLRREGEHTHVASGSAAEMERDLPEGGKTHRYVEFAVSDDGPGMDEEVRRRALDPFFTTKETNSGTGLGLSMVYGFIQQSDGEMRIYSEKGHGTTIRLLIPRGAADGGREDLVERAPRPKGDGQTILVVEDEAHLAEMLGDVIRSFGYRVVHANRGEAALKVLESDQGIDCMLTDVVMPGGMGGFDLASAARKIRLDVPIVYMSGYTGFSEAQMGDVIAPILSKPASPAELSVALNAALTSLKGGA